MTLRLLPVTPESPSVAAMRPTVLRRETFSRHGAVMTTTAVASLVSGRLELVSIWLQAGDLVSEFSFWAGSVGATNPSHQVAALYNTSRQLLAQSTDLLTTAWAIGARQAFPVASPYVVPQSGRYLIGFWVVADTPPNLLGATTSATPNGVTPVLVGSSSTGLTDTPPATAAALTARAGTAYGGIA